MNRALMALLLLPTVTLAAPVPKSKSVLIVTTLENNRSCVTRVNPDGTGETILLGPNDTEGMYEITLSPDLKKVAYVTADPKGESRHGWIKDLASGEKTEGIQLDEINYIFWSPDGKRAFFVDDEGMRTRRELLKENWRCRSVDVATGKVEELKGKGSARPTGVTADGKSLICERPGDHVQVAPQIFYVGKEVISTDLKRADPVVLIAADRRLRARAAFPDGKQWLVSRVGKGGVGLFTSGEKEPVMWEEEPDGGENYTASPDGKCVAYSTGLGKMERERRELLERQQRKQGLKATLEPEEHTLWISTPDGKNAKKVWEPKKYIAGVDWR